MFGNEKNQNRKTNSGPKDGGVTILTAGCHFAGKLYCKGATRIGGTIEGEVIAEGLLIVEEDAVINASVKAEEIVVHGRVDGNISVLRKIEMCATSDVHADVTTPNLVVHEGALYNGRTTMKKAASSSTSGKKDGSKSQKDPSSKRIAEIPVVEPVAEIPTNVAARSPDISFA
jgi:cytoskeletal protein CcmA (bactofilin family)